MSFKLLKISSLSLMLLSLGTFAQVVKAEQYIYRPNITLCRAVTHQEDYIQVGSTNIMPKITRYGYTQVTCPLLGPVLSSDSILVNKVSALVYDADGANRGQSVYLQIRSHLDAGGYPINATISSDSYSEPGDKWISTNTPIVINPDAGGTYILAKFYRSRQSGVERPILKALKVEYEDYR